MDDGRFNFFKVFLRKFEKQKFLSNEIPRNTGKIDDFDISFVAYCSVAFKPHRFKMVFA